MRPRATNATRLGMLACFMTGLVLVLSACRSIPNDPPGSAEASVQRFEYARVVMGSKARVVLYAPDEPAAAHAAGVAFDEMERLNAVLSDYDPNSEAMRLCAAPIGAWHDVSPDLIEVLTRSRDIHQKTNAAFDPTVGPLSRLWREARRSGSLPSASQITEALERVGMDRFKIDERHGQVRLERPGMVLDFGGIGKGHAAGRAVEVLRELGFPRALVDLGGDLALGAPPPGKPGWDITVQTGPDQTRRLTLANTAVATSGDLYQFLEIDGVRYSHIIDPRTGRPVTDRIAVTVIAPDAALADALASAISVLGADGIDIVQPNFPGVDVIIARPAGQ